MGTTHPSKLESPEDPPRPFDRVRQSCLREHFFHHNKSEHSSTNIPPLHQLILRQDWQRVLIRVDRFPSELRLPLALHVYGLELQVWPLHLVCALDPPLPVVELFLKHYVDATALALRPLPRLSSETHRTGRAGARVRPQRSRRRSGLERFRQWRQSRRGAFPVSPHDLARNLLLDDEERGDDESLQQRRYLLGPTDRGSNLDDGNRSSVGHSHYGPPDLESRIEEGEDEENEDDEEEESNQSSLSTTSSHAMTDALLKPSMILQLSPSGGLTPLPMNQSNQTESTSELSEKTEPLFRVRWDLQPLRRFVGRNASLLPLHVACLFDASAEVVDALVKVYPLAALVDVVGMIPIHFVAAGYKLDPLETTKRARALPVCFWSDEPKPGPLPCLQVLRRACPDSLQVRSGNHGMSPEDYVMEMMTDGEYKNVCLRILTDGALDAALQLNDRISSRDTVFFVDSSEASSSIPAPVPGLRRSLVTGLSNLMTSRDWNKALAALEDDPKAAFKWYFGVDDEACGRGSLVWKRLPLHLAVLYGAPVGLVDFLVRIHPEGASMEDPHDGSLPLHMACRSKAPVSVIQTLMRACPEATKAVDMFGRSPLHVAVREGASTAVLEYILQIDPEAAVCLDQTGKTPVDLAMEASNQVNQELLSMVLHYLEEQNHA